ncbi:flagellar hook-basal body complex protein FliE [Paracoccus sp. P2]|uniref:Flagellar hook-basal body complex protein FliE n=1 Tax=Paracoccus pantotrophus TaxID=82367 RepID=A0A1I5MB83_PARPN|nr:flagellar hook-basal body complex protein FliE [Paracoccus pantotrophus]MDF3856313.1 flagellar hook-basal body complex protein FliE [Paracoccus pantotrophus]QFG37876.1 flagellar hook-basal body protein FliE [Paracoccus pantotrophus]QLH15427.1 flagellar hook-basal body complex protein FliE [Paracoccus pantotrophus]RDD94256.1 flagellar hook-basal body protein FliE [Paracoccus pantotrophus]RKS51649.1 flagellar hook-basal body complex protein FliE [Paracoccus pantotrophus]
MISSPTIAATSAATAYDRARHAVAPAAGLPQGVTNAATDFARVMERVDLAATGAMTGKTETHDLVHSIAQAEIALETVVAIRDKVVEAYQEILRMPV